jgi:hypothetical protein
MKTVPLLFTNRLRALLASLSIICLLSPAPRADEAYVAVSPPAGQNLYVAVIDTGTDSVTATIPLSLTTHIWTASILNVGDRVFVSARDLVYEINTATRTVTRTIVTPWNNADRMIMDSANRLLVLNYSGSVGQIDLATGLASSLFTAEVFAPTDMAIRPGTRELYVGQWSRGISVFDLDTRRFIRRFADSQTGMNIKNNLGIHNLDFLDANTLLVGHYGAARWDLSTGVPVHVFNSVDGDAGWGYDWAVTTDGTRILQPGWTRSRIRSVSDWNVLAYPALANFYYGSAACGADGSFLLSGGDLNGYGSPGVGKLLIGSQDTLNFRTTIDFGSTHIVMLRGNPYRVTAPNGDSDDDGVLDSDDAFPNDATETADNDDDGIGDNADTDDDNDGAPDVNDAFPFDPTESVDTDRDGIGNNADSDDDNDGVPDVNDALPLDRAESVDTDGDGIGNNADPDDDNDGVADANDAFPLDPRESVDSDGDGSGNNADADDDNDGVADANDAFPLDPTESADNDGDGTGNNADPDDDNDGLTDIEESALGTNPFSGDSDGDGVADLTEVNRGTNPTGRDSDGDGSPDGTDPLPLSDMSPTVTINGVNSGVANRLISAGATLADYIRAASDDCVAGAKNHGQYVSCVSQTLNALGASGVITGAEKGALQSAAGGSSVGRK